MKKHQNRLCDGGTQKYQDMMKKTLFRLLHFVSLVMSV
jgi:hypothetical protein